MVLHPDYPQLVTTLSIFYNVLSDLCWYEPSNILTPPDEGWPLSRLDVDAARENGISEDAITLVSKLPFLEEPEYNVIYETQPVKYLEPGHWPGCRRPLEPEQYASGEDVRMPGHIVRLTQGVYYICTILLYDTQRARLIALEPDESEAFPDWTSLPAYPLTHPRSALAQWLLPIMLLERACVSATIYPAPISDFTTPDDINADWSLEQQRSCAYEKTIVDLYLSCGWDLEPPRRLRAELDREATDDAQSPPSAATKPLWVRLEEAWQQASRNFRRDEFIRRRQEWTEIGKRDWFFDYHEPPVYSFAPTES